jgi:hypothetical protein
MNDWRGLRTNLRDLSDLSDLRDRRHLCDRRHGSNPSDRRDDRDLTGRLRDGSLSSARLKFRNGRNDTR